MSSFLKRLLEAAVKRQQFIISQVYSFVYTLAAVCDYCGGGGGVTLLFYVLILLELKVVHI